MPVLSLGGALRASPCCRSRSSGGTALAAVVSVASMLAFNWFFLPPAHTFHLREGQNWLALAVYLVIAFAVSALAARARARREDAEQRRAEAHALAEAALDLLRGTEPRRGARPARGSRRRRARGRAGAPRARRAAAEAGRAGPAGRGRAPLRRDALRRGGATVDDAVPAPLPAVARRAARRRRRAQPAGGRSARSGGAAPQRCAQDGAPPRGLPRPALAADRDPRLGGRARQSGSRRSSRSDRLRARRGDSRRGDTARSRRRAAARPLTARGRSGRAASRALARGRARRPGARRSRRGGRRASARDRSGDAAGRGGRGPDRARAREPHRQRAPATRRRARASWSARSPVRPSCASTSSTRGPGLPDEERESLFQPFRRGTARARRSGLGLAIARGFAEANGGRLWAQDDPAGGHLVLSLPLAAQPAVPA